MKSFTKLSLLILMLSLSIISYSQQSAMYQRAADLCEAVAKKYDAKGCPASAAYCRKMKQWNLCMVNALAGKTNSCGIEPLPENAPKCDESAIGGTSNSSSGDSDPQQRYQQTQIELDNAKTVSMSAYQEAINSGKKESGAMLDATLAGAQQISDAKSQLIYAGVGLGISLFTNLAEKKADKEAQKMAIQQENLHQKLIVETKVLFIKDLQNINKYTFEDLVNKKRFAVLLILPRNFIEDEQTIYFTLPTVILPYSDSSYPSKDEIKTKLLGCVNNDIKQNKSLVILYPIINVDEFQKNFIKKIGSGNIIYLNAQLANLIKQPYNLNQNNETDFWGNPIKKQPNTKNDNSFWNQ